MIVIEKLKLVGGRLKKGVSALLVVGMLATSIVAFVGCAEDDGEKAPTQSVEQTTETNDDKHNGQEQNPETSDPQENENNDDEKQPEVDPTQGLEEAVLALETALEKYGEIQAYDLISGNLYFYAKKDGEIKFFKLKTEGDLDTTAGAEKIGLAVEQNDATALATFLAAGSSDENDQFVTINGYEIPLKGAKGVNELAQKLLDNSAFSVTSTSLGLENGKATMKVAVVNSYGITLGKSEVEATELSQEVIDQLYTSLEIEEIVSLGIPQNLLKSSFPTQKPNNPPITPDDPIVEELDFTALENKLEEVILDKYWGRTLEKIIAYSAENGKMNLMFEVRANSTGLKAIYLHEISIIAEDLTSQENIDIVAQNIKKSDFSQATMQFTEASTDITVSGQTYSKDGIEGENPFASQCGIENPILTWVGNLNRQSYANTDTGYGWLVDVLCFYENADGELTLCLKQFVAESASYLSAEEIYQNLLTEGKNYLNKEEVFVLGKALNSLLEVEKEEVGEL